MTDEEAFVKLFNRLGIEWEQGEPTVTGTCYEIQAKTTPHVDGYHGFITSFYFDHDGKFIETRIWE